MTTAYLQHRPGPPRGHRVVAHSRLQQLSAYIEGVTESVIEDGRRGDEVGAVRRFCYRGNWVRQRLGGHSDKQRLLSYIGIDPLRVSGRTGQAETPSPVLYEGAMHLLRIMDGERTFIEWSVALDTVPDEADSWWTRTC